MILKKKAVSGTGRFTASVGSEKIPFGQSKRNIFETRLQLKDSQ